MTYSHPASDFKISINATCHEIIPPSITAQRNEYLIPIDSAPVSLTSALPWASNLRLGPHAPTKESPVGIAINRDLRLTATNVDAEIDVLFDIRALDGSTSFVQSWSANLVLPAPTPLKNLQMGIAASVLCITLDGPLDVRLVNNLPGGSTANLNLIAGTTIINAKFDQIFVTNSGAVTVTAKMFAAG